MGFFSKSQHLDKSNLAVADIAAAVPDGNLPVVLDPALAAQDVVDAGRHLVPLVVVSSPEWKEIQDDSGYCTLTVIAAAFVAENACVRACVCASLVRQQILTPAD